MMEQLQFFGQLGEIAILGGIFFRLGAISTSIKDHERRLTKLEGRPKHDNRRNLGIAE